MLTAADLTKRLALALRAAITDCSHGGDVEANCARCRRRWALIKEAGGVDPYPVVEGRVIDRYPAPYQVNEIDVIGGAPERR